MNNRRNGWESHGDRNGDQTIVKTSGSTDFVNTRSSGWESRGDRNGDQSITAKCPCTARNLDILDNQNKSLVWFGIPNIS